MKKTTTKKSASIRVRNTESKTTVLSSVKSALLKFRKLLTENANGTHSTLPTNRHW